MQQQLLLQGLSAFLQDSGEINNTKTKKKEKIPRERNDVCCVQYFNLNSVYVLVPGLENLAQEEDAPRPEEAEFFTGFCLCVRLFFSNRDATQRKIFRLFKVCFRFFFLMKKGRKKNDEKSGSNLKGRRENLLKQISSNSLET